MFFDEGPNILWGNGRGPQRNVAYEIENNLLYRPSMVNKVIKYRPTGSRKCVQSQKSLFNRHCVVCCRLLSFVVCSLNVVVTSLINSAVKIYLHKFP